MCIRDRDAIVMRSKNQEDFKIAQKILNFPVINAGSGIDSHPTQALSDLKTLKENFNDFNNLKISIVGDLLHSRVANSFIEAFGKYNLKTNLFSPPYFKPKKIDFGKVIFYENFDECLNNSDVVMALRVQKERFKIPMLWYGDVLKDEYKARKMNRLGSHIDISSTLSSQ